MQTKFHFRIDETIRKNRLDSFVCDRITTVSKMFLRRAIEKGYCRVNEKIESRGGYHLKENDTVEIEIDSEAVTAMKPENIRLEIVFEDAEIIVVNKPAGMLVHPTLGQKNGTLLNALSFYLNDENQLRITNYELRETADISDSRFRIPKSIDETSALGARQSKFVRPGLIHRLDRETSGLMVVAKTKRAHRVLSDHFGRRLVEKKYSALVEGIVEDDSGTINAPIGRRETEKCWGVKADGKNAETAFQVVERFSDKTLLSLAPVTGRTNQLRIHCAYSGHPIVGDKLYNGGEFSRLCLHATKLGFWHPNGGKWMEFENRIQF